MRLRLIPLLFAAAVAFVACATMRAGRAPPAWLRSDDAPAPESDAPVDVYTPPGSTTTDAPAPPKSGGPTVDCLLGSDGRQACGYACRLGSNGVAACADTPNGKCALNSDGTVTCSRLLAHDDDEHRVEHREPRAEQAKCRSSIDCGAGAFCKDRGDGVKLCMGSGGTNEGCNSSIDCGAGKFCKDPGNGKKVCMGDGGGGDACKSSIDCGAGMFCHDNVCR